MTEDNTRRTFVKAIGGASFTGIPRELLGNSSPEDDTTPPAAEMMLPETALPEGFDRIPVTDTQSVSFVEDLQSKDSQFKSSDVAVAGYWKGTDQENPEWVVSSLAIVTEKPISREVVETATSKGWDEYVAGYDDETSPFVEFEQSYSRGEQTSEWGIDIFRTPFGISRESESTPLYTERLRLRFFEKVLIGTIVFGPTGASPSVDSLVEEYAETQHRRYKSHSSAIDN